MRADATRASSSLEAPEVQAEGTQNREADPTTAIAFSRTPQQVLNIVYLGAAATMGGFFPNGVNGNIKMSAAN